MKVESTPKNLTGFGFRYQTHANIAQKVIEESFPKLEKYLPEIKRGVQMPDFEEKGIKCNTHFYFPVESVFKPRESFLDFIGTLNARSKFNHHIDLMEDLHSFNRISQAVGVSARAKHFLDDVAIGLHVKRGNCIQKWFEKGLHKDFEAFIRKNEKSLLTNSQKGKFNIKSDDYEDIFLSVVEYSKNSEMPTVNNKNKWNEIAQNSVNLALDASREFFTKISDLVL